MPDNELIFENLPMLLNLGDFGSQAESVIGWASASKDETGKVSITINMDEETSKDLIDLTTIFQLRALGFAGIMRRSQ